MKPVLSIIMAAHNNQKTIKRCIDSFYALHTNLLVEILCIDDHSTDQTLSIVREYPQIKLFFSTKRGLSASRNEGIKKASGKYLWFIDCDDELLVNSVNEHFLQELSKGKKDLYLLGVKKIYKRGSQLVVNSSTTTYDLKKDNTVKNIFEENIFNCSWNKIYRRQLILEHHLQFADVSSVEDAIFNCDYLPYAQTICTVSRVFYCFYVYSQTSTKRSWRPDALDASLKMMKKLKQLEQQSLLVSRNLIAINGINTVINNAFNMLIKSPSLNFKNFHQEWRSKEMKSLRSDCHLLFNNYQYLMKYFITQSSLLCYWYIHHALRN